MKYGVRNVLKAKVASIKKGDIMSQLECRLEEAGALSSVLTTDSLNDLGLKEGDQVVLLVKAIHVVPLKE